MWTSAKRNKSDLHQDLVAWFEKHQWNPMTLRYECDGSGFAIERLKGTAVLHEVDSEIMFYVNNDPYIAVKIKDDEFNHGTAFKIEGEDLVIGLASYHGEITLKPVE